MAATPCKAPIEATNRPGTLISGHRAGFAVCTQIRFHSTPLGVSLISTPMALS